MTNLFLHIGTPKTGTTAIQIFLQRNIEALKNKDCYFPDFKFRFEQVRSQRNGHFLSSSVTDENIKNFCFEQIIQNADKYSKIVLTDEVLWNERSSSVSFWKELKEKLNNNNINLKVIIYLRRQDTYIASHWAQKIKGVRMQTFTFNEFLNNRAKTDIILDYYSQLQFISSIIGKENLIVRPYEFSQFKNNSIIEDFLDCLDIEFDNSFEVENVLRNISIEGNVLEVKRYLNKISAFRKHNTYFQPLLVKVQTRLKKDGKFKNYSTFTNNMRKTFMDKYVEGNSKIAEEFLHFDDKTLFRESLPTNDPFNKSYSVKELKLILKMLYEENSWNPISPIADEEFKQISDRAYNLILHDKSKIRILKRKIKNKIKLMIH